MLGRSDKIGYHHEINAPGPDEVPYVIDIIDVDGEAAIVLPAAVLAQLGVEPGDTIDVVDGANEGVSIRRHLSEHERQAKIAGEVMRDRRQALRDLGNDSN